MPPAAEWHALKLGELGLVGRGKSKHRPRNDPSLYGGPYPFFQTGDVKAAGLFLTSYSQTYNDEGLRQSKLWPPGTLCITIAANIAETAILGVPGCFPDSVVGFVADPTKADARFVKYAIDTVKLQMQGVSHGTTQDNLSLDKLLSFELRVPPIELQRQIANALSAYDELAANHCRRCEVLREIARGLFCEWFEDLRYPGSESGGAVPDVNGALSGGWESRFVSDFADFVRGLEPGADAYLHAPTEGAVKFLRVGDLSKRDSEVYVRAESVGDRILEPSDVAMTFDGSVGLVRLGLCGAYSSGIRKLVVRDRSRLGWSFAYHLLRSDQIQEIVQAHARGTTIKHAGSAAESLAFAAPPSALVAQFEELTEPMLRQVLVLERDIANLRRTRDLLLPRLMSGQIRLDEAAA